LKDKQKSHPESWLQYTDLTGKIWWPLLGLNQRPSDYESQFEINEITNLLIFMFSLSRIVMKSGT